MNIKYDILFQVDLIHTYYRRKGSDFIVEPTERTRSLLNRYGLLFKKTQAGFVVLYEVNADGSGGTKAVRPVEEDLVLSFATTSASPYVLNYSDLPLDRPNERIYRFHNVRENRQNNLLLLSADTAKPAVTGQDLVPLRPCLFHHAIAAAVPLEIELKHELLGTVVNTRIAPVEGVVDIPVDVRRFSPGMFQLKAGGQSALSFYAGDELTAAPVFGMVDIFHTAAVPAASRFADANGRVTPRTYTVRFNHRETYWRYNVALKYDASIDEQDLSVQHPDGTVTFRREAVQETPGQGKIISFLSNKALALQEQPVQNIILGRKTNGNQRTLMKDLPNAPITSLARGAAGEFISDMYIFL
jgi:hypothetical protein